MGNPLTREKVLALAPDDASARAASGLLADSQWLSLGADEEAAWGECKGSGAKPYQTQVELAALVSRCSCPSRKFPCKHGLALLLLHAQGNPRFGVSSRPDWLNEWVSARKEKTVKKEQAAAEKPAVDPTASAAAAAKREAARWQRIEAGAQDLQRWIADQFRRGLGKAIGDLDKEGRALAARMVDAQAPGLSLQLLTAIESINGERGNHEELIERLGLLQVLATGVRQRHTLSAARMADMRTAIGWPHDRDEVLASGAAVDDVWQVIGQCIATDDERLSERRVWLMGLTSSRQALLLDFAFKGKGWDSVWMTGETYRASLAFYPGSVPLRAIATGQVPASQAAVGPKARPQISSQSAVDGASHRFAQNPWLPRVPVQLDPATPRRVAERWLLHNEAGNWPLSVSNASAWSLLAHSGGHPLRVMGEWDGRMLRPLSACQPDESRPSWTLESSGAAA